ncbi:MAG: MFS transporter [Synergistetes bacterium]|nr:MFS transporter [Synergistota bacterium]MCX8127826.1 MFS transporter [Synergistota bacterium]MDW8192088.1 MFS transporter [Synergistota bacterium]
MKNILILTITIGILSCLLFSWYFLLPLYLKELGASDKMINVAYFIFNLIFYIGQVPGGILSDKFGRKPIIAITTIVYAFSGYGIHLSKNWIEAFIFYSIGCLSSSIQLPAIYAMTFESQKHKGLSFSLTSFSYNLGLALGPLIGAFLLKKTDIKGLLIIYSIAAFIIGITRIILLEETLSKRNLDPREKASLLRGKLFLFSGGIFFFLSITLTINGPYISLYLKESLNLLEKDINMIFTKIGITSALTCLAFSKIVGHIDPAKTWAIASLLHPFLLFLWALLRAPLFILILSTIFVEIAYIVYPILASKAFPEKLRGKGLGLFGFVTGGMGSLSPLLLNLFNEKPPLPLPFVLATIFGFLAFWFIIKAGGDFKNEHQ